MGPANYLTISPSDFLSLKRFKMVHILRVHGNWVESKVCGFSFFFPLALINRSGLFPFDIRQQKMEEDTVPLVFSKALLDDRVIA